MSETDELITAIQAGETAKLADLYTQFYKLICKIANKFSTCCDIEDLQQQGFLGLYNAAKTYKPGYDVFFWYAANRIKNSIRRYAYKERRRGLLTDRGAENLKREEAARESFRDQTGREPTKKELHQLYGIDTEKNTGAHALKNICSIEAELTENLTIGDTIAAADDPEKETIDKAIAAQIWEQVNSLQPLQRDIITANYKEDQTEPEISESMNLPRQRVTSEKQKGIRVLQKSKILKQIYIDLYGIGIRYSSYGFFKATGTSSPELAILKMDY